MQHINRALKIKEIHILATFMRLSLLKNTHYSAALQNGNFI